MKTTSQIANEILDAMLAKAKAYQVSRATDGGNAECRDWAQWENPSDMPEDEADDYDHQILTANSANLLDEISKKFIGSYPNHFIHISTEEKNWISIQVSVNE